MTLYRWLRAGMGCGFLLGQNMTRRSEEENSGADLGLERATSKGKHFIQESIHIYRHSHEPSWTHTLPSLNTLRGGRP